MSTRREMEESTRRRLWREVEDHTAEAKHSLEEAQAALEALGEHDHAASLQPLIDSFPARDGGPVIG